MGALISYPDFTQWATLSGGNWSTALPLNNLKNPLLSLKARTNDAVTASGVIDVTLDAFCNVRTIGVLGHNISQVRVRAYSDSGRTAVIYDSGLTDVYPAFDAAYDNNTTYDTSDALTALKMATGQIPDNLIYDLDGNSDVNISDAIAIAGLVGSRSNVMKNMLPHWIKCLSADVKAKYWRVELTAAYGATYMELGRLWMGPAAIQPAVSISYGASLRFESRDKITESIGGVDYVEKRQARRIASVQWEVLSDIDKYKMLMLQYNLGLSGELLWIMDSAANPRQMMFEAFLAKVNQSSAINYPYHNNYELPLEFKEIV